MPTLEKSIKEKIFRGKKSRSGKTFHEKHLNGYFVAGLVDGRLGIGFSMCHKRDRYDMVNGVRMPGHGLMMAAGRATKCAETGKIEVPPSLFRKAIKFAARCNRYYKESSIPLITKQEMTPPPHRQTHLFVETRQHMEEI